MRQIIILIALLALWPGCGHAQINQDTVNSDVPGGGGGGGGLSQEDIDTLAELNNIITPDVLGTTSSQSMTNKLIDCNGNTCKPLRGEDCTVFDAATGGQYCVDTDDRIIYFCSVGEEDPCDDAEEWVAVSSASTLAGLDDVTLTDPQDDDVLVYDTGEFVNKTSVPLADVATSADSADDLDCTDCVALGTETSGNYVGNVATTSPLSGGSSGSEGASLTLTIANAAADGSTKGAASFAANDFDASSGNVSIDYTNGQAASTSTKGFLTSTDWDTFNAKLDAADIDSLGELATLSNFTLSGNTTVVGTTSGELTSGDCVEFDADGNLVAAGDPCGSGGGGSAITLDLGDDGGDDSTDLNEIAITGDTNSIFTEPANDKLLIDVSNNWPTADSADDLDCTGCVGDSELASTFLKSADIDTFAELDTIVADETLVNTNDAQTLTNKTISGASNTLSNIDWSSLVNVPAFRKTLIQLRPQANEPPASNFATMFSRNGHPGLSFDGNVCAIWSFVLPNTYGGNGVTVDIYTVSSGTANDLDWDGSWERIETTQDIDSDSFATAVSADNNNNSATSGVPTKVSIAFTDGAQMDSCASGELCRFRLCRDDTADTTAATNGLAVMIGGQIRETP